jgi:hypothetical protein
MGLPAFFKFLDLRQGEKVKKNGFGNKKIWRGGKVIRLAPRRSK